MRLRLLAVALASVLSGCASKPADPQWLAELDQVACKGVITKQCVSDVIVNHLASAAQSPDLITGTLHYIAAAEAKSVPWTLPGGLSVPYRTAATNFAASVREAKSGTIQKAIDLAKAIPDFTTRTLALYYIVLFDQHQRESQASDALTILLAEDKWLYVRAMSMRLDVLLMSGDIERGRALREHLIELVIAENPNSIPDINDLALVYARTGMILDLNDWMGRASVSVPALNKGSEARLRFLLTDAALGRAPSSNEMATIHNQDVRFAAYLELVRLYKHLGNKQYESHAIQDAVLFSQISAMSLDPVLRAEYLSSILFESSAL